MNTEPPLLEDNADVLTSSGELSARQQLKNVAGDIRVLFDSELQYYKARLSYTRTVAKWTGVYLLISVCALFGTIMACIIGALLIAASYMGPILGTAAVCATSLLVTVIFAVLARHKSRNFILPEIDRAKNNTDTVSQEAGT
jgi:Putative Actinobacterial Holin-X, holin superfamily III